MQLGGSHDDFGARRSAWHSRSQTHERASGVGGLWLQKHCGGEQEGKEDDQEEGMEDEESVDEKEQT